MQTSKQKILMVKFVYAYPQIVARTAWHASCLTSLAAIAVKKIASTFDLPLTTTRTLFITSQLSSATDQADTSCQGERTATLFRFLALVSPRGDLDSSLSLPSA